MPAKKGRLKICPEGHQFYKSSDCPVCPVCEKQQRTGAGFLSLLSAPARRALEGEKIVSLKRLSQYTEADILKLHGVGKTTLPILKKVLLENGMDFKQ